VEDLVDSLTRGNVSQVQTVLASVVAVLSAYQVFLMAVGFGKLQLPFLKSNAASLDSTELREREERMEERLEEREERREERGD